MCLQMKEMVIYKQIRGLLKKTNTINTGLNMTNNIFYDIMNLEWYVECEVYEYSFPMLSYFHESF